MSQKKYRKLRAMAKVKEEKINELGLEVVNDIRKRKSFWDLIKKNWGFLLLLLIGTVLLYLNAQDGAFVSDDYATISQNPKILDVKDAFLHPAMTFNSMHMSNYFVSLVFGNQNPIAHHVFSLVLYLIFLIIAFGFVAKLFGERIAIITSLIFAAHPIHVEAVSWISGRIYVFIGLYILLGFMAFINYIETGKLKYIIWTGVCFILGYLTDRPRPFSLVLLILLYMWYVGWNNKIIKERVHRFMPYIWASFVLFVIFAIPFIKIRINAVNSGYNFSESIFYNPFFQYPTGLAKYLQILWIPVDMTLYHTLYVFEPWLNWLITLLMLGCLIYFYIKSKKYFFAWMFMLLVLAPSMAPIKVSWLVAERYMFLGSLGFCMFLAFLYEDIDKRIKVVAPILLTILLMFYCVRTYLRNDDWQTNHKLWVRTVQYSYNSHNAWNNIGDDYDKLGQMDNAIKGFGQSYVVKPNYADAYHNQANIFFKIKRYDLARAGYEKALSYGPGLYQSYISLTQVALFQNDLNGAYGYASKLLEVQPNNSQAHYVMGVVMAQAGKMDEAKKYINQALKLNPDFVQARTILQQLEMATKGKGSS